jgi:hypothetical protein
MTYLIWIVSFLVGVALMMQDSPLNYLGLLVIVGGALVGYRIGRTRDQEKQAERIADAIKRDDSPDV